MKLYNPSFIIPDLCEFELAGQARKSWKFHTSSVTSKLANNFSSGSQRQWFNTVIVANTKQ